MRLSGTDALAIRSKQEAPERRVAGYELRRHPPAHGVGQSTMAKRRSRRDQSSSTKDFASYLYLPRLKDPAVLAEAIRSGLALLTWEQDTFAYAESYDEVAGRYRGVRFGQQVPVSEDDSGLLVKPAVARQQVDKETAAQQVIPGGPGPTPPEAGPASSIDRGAPRPAEAPQTQAFLWDRCTRSITCRTRCRPHRRRGDLAPGWARRLGHQGHARDRSGDPFRNAG